MKKRTNRYMARLKNTRASIMGLSLQNVSKVDPSQYTWQDGKIVDLLSENESKPILLQDDLEGGLVGYGLKEPFLKVDIADAPSTGLEKTLPLEVRVKWRIIGAGMLVGFTPDTLNNELELVNDLQFSEKEYADLCSDLSMFVLEIKPDEVLSCSDVSDCEKVKDVVDLIKKTIK
ncbi:MAG: hypothetical protein JO154_12070 [Chitinophaga sp.]|uniref:hypothetical protein n=1 Tax=Chitinophaga sp. TaxID=1869181 RepID=UPI0025C68D6E|nr:hypothetical protein [Chitinophaga sp.]MBV8253336.1 hypothetical protein [Chitinophaga sp.]